MFYKNYKKRYPNKYFLDLEIEKYGKLLGRFSRLKNSRLKIRNSRFYIRLL